MDQHQTRNSLQSKQKLLVNLLYHTFAVSVPLFFLLCLFLHEIHNVKLQRIYLLICCSRKLFQSLCEWTTFLPGKSLGVG